jgi:hypothetical protein
MTKVYETFRKSYPKSRANFQTALGPSSGRANTVVRELDITTFHLASKNSSLCMIFSCSNRLKFLLPL